MYIRFAVTQRDEDSGHPMGVFAAARDLGESSDAHPDVVARLHELREWFNDNLPGPGDNRREVVQKSIFWFKSGAGECLRRVWELVSILQENGYIVRDITCSRPGKIVYEDDLQVGAIPFRDVRARL